MRYKRICSIISIFVLMICMSACAKIETSKTTSKEAKKQEETKTAAISAVEEVTTAGFTPTTIELVMVGDVLLHDPINESGKMADGTYNYDHIFAHVTEDIQKADVAIANQEVILGGRDIGLSGYPAFNGAYEVGDSLVKAGFDVILHATNHTLDRGKQGVLNCIDFWESKYPKIAYLGINKTQEHQDDYIYVYEKEGVKIAILNYTYGTNGIPLPSDMPYIVNLMVEEEMAEDIKKAKALADFVVVCPHWGVEYTHTAPQVVLNWCDFFSEQGVDLVIGAHSHVIQPVKMYDRADGGKMLVYYSLGNFINSTADSGTGTADRMVGAMAKVTITNDESGKVFIKDYEAVPLVTQMAFGSGKPTTYKLSDYTESLAKANEIVNRDSRFSLEFCENLSVEVLGDAYKKQH
ncbi:MAG: CapA family protein [Lachnospiraceae bacterium]|nr:CapA family protein [Lachnospiraceae bacterium]